MNIGDRIRELRASRNLTLRELAERSDLTLNAIGRIERGEREPNVSTLVKLSTGLGVEPGELFPKDKAPSGSGRVGREEAEALETLRKHATVLRRVAEKKRHELEGVSQESLEDLAYELNLAYIGALEVSKETESMRYEPVSTAIRKARRDVDNAVDD